jgi:hypothetical protein
VPALLAGQVGGTVTATVALTYAGMGLYVFPCVVKGRDKTPLVKWRAESTTDPQVIGGWWKRWPDALVAVDCGKSRLIVVDLDVKDGIDGPGNWKRLVAGHDVPSTFYVRTPSKGWHLWFRDPDGKYRNSAGQIAPAVDIRADGGLVVAPGSAGYTWHAEAPLSLDDIPVMPDGIIPTSNGGGTTGHWKKLDRTTLEPRDLAALEALEVLGGHGAYLSDGHVTVTRPGKIAGASVSIGHIGPGIVKVFTPNWPPLQEGNVYDADKLVTFAQPGTKGAGSRTVRLTSASAITMRRVQWLWDARLAVGILALLAGREGLGKSTFAYWLVARITRGELSGERKGQPRAVLVCATEDSWEHTIVPRLTAAGADLTLVYRIEVVTAGDITIGVSLPRDLHEVEQAAHDKNAALLLLDPLMSRIADDIDPHKDLEVRQALEPLTWVANRTGMTVLGIIHLNKTGSVDILDRVMGSKAFAAVARAVCAVVPDPDDETGGQRLFGVPKNNLGRSDLPSIRFTIQGTVIQTADGPSDVGAVAIGDETETTIHEAMERNGEDADVRTQVADAKTWLKEYLTEHSHSDSREVKKVAAAQGFAERTLQRARKSLRVVMTRLSESPPRTVWSLPPAIVPTPRGEGITGTTDINAGQSPVSDLGGMPNRASRASPATPREGGTIEAHCVGCGKPIPAYQVDKRGGRCVGCHLKAGAA